MSPFQLRSYLFTIPTQLTIEHFASIGTLGIFWPLPGTDFLLQQANALNGPPLTGWSTVPVASYQTNATHIFITFPQPTGQKFYRLREP